MENEPLIRDLLTKAGIPTEHHDVFIGFQVECHGKVGGYGLNRWIWGIFHEISTWLPTKRICAEFDQSEGKWFVSCSEGHLSDNWEIDQYGAIYWCGHLKSVNYRDIIQQYDLDYHHLEKILRSETISKASKMRYVTNDVHILMRLLIGAPQEVVSMVDALVRSGK